MAVRTSDSRSQSQGLALCAEAAAGTLVLGSQLPRLRGTLRVYASAQSGRFGRIHRILSDHGKHCITLPFSSIYKLNALDETLEA